VITLWTAGSIIEKCRDSLAKSAGEEVSSHIGRWIFTDLLKLEQRGELGKKRPEQLPSAVIWPALIDCSPELWDKAPRGSNLTRLWHREMDRNMENSTMRLAAAIAEQRRRATGYGGGGASATCRRP